MKRVTVAIGGNMILQKGDRGSYEDQMRRLYVTARILADLVEEGIQLVITHGNGPQVGSLLLAHEIARYKIPSQPLSILDAMTQGQIGAMIELTLRNELQKRGIYKNVIVVPTMVLVDKSDAAFDNPTKPIGPYYDEETARKLQSQGKGVYVEDSGRGWRRVVPSPVPKGIIEIDLIRTLVENDNIVIACGGGGIPVIRNDEGRLDFIDAVIDKDRASQVLANLLSCNELLILTDVPNAFINYGTKEQRPLEEVTVEQLEQFIKDGHFSRGSMLPKIEAIREFVLNGGEIGVITNPELAKNAVKNGAGTRVRR